MSFSALLRGLNQERVRFVLIGAAGANYYAAATGSPIFATQDRDLLLPLDSENTLKTWQVCQSCGLDLLSLGEPLGEPLDSWLADRVVQHRATVQARGSELWIDLSYEMSGFEFDEIWQRRRLFEVDEVEVPVARLVDIVDSKRVANRDKDRLFLSTYEDLLEKLLTMDLDPK